MVYEAEHKPDDRVYLAGKAAGEKWSEERATPAELEHIQRLFERLSNDPGLDWDWYFFEREPAPYTRAQQFAVDATGANADEIDVESEAAAFWSEAVGGYRGNDALNDGRFLQGFADAALEVWEQVRGRL